MDMFLSKGYGGVQLLGCFGGANGGEPKLFALHHGFVPRAGDALSTFLPITMADTKNPRQQKSWQSLPQKWQIDFWHVLK